MFLKLSRLVLWLSDLMVFALFMRAILSWLQANPSSPLWRIRELCIKITDPVVVPCRRFLSRFNTGMFDFSVFAAMILVQFAARALVSILRIFYF